MTQNYKVTRLPPQMEEYMHKRGELCAPGKLFCRGSLIIVTKELPSHVLELAHEGHPGTVAMKKRLRSKKCVILAMAVS